MQIQCTGTLQNMLCNVLYVLFFVGTVSQYSLVGMLRME